MINLNAQIIITTHGDLACALLRAVEAIAGIQQNLHCVALNAGEDIQLFRERLRAAIDVNKPVLILVDMPGGTPWNVAVAITLNSAPMSRVVSGVNLSMLLEVSLATQGLDLDQLAQLARQAGLDAITIARTGTGACK